MSTTADANIELLLSVGTDFHPFNRLIDWTDQWLSTHPEVAAHALIQYGSSRPPAHGSGVPLLAHPELQTSMRHASIVVCHAGPATVSEVRGHGVTPICVARDPDHGEHVDRHQQRFAQHMYDAGLVKFCPSRETYHHALDAALASASKAATYPASRVPIGVEHLAEVVERLTHGGRLFERSSRPR